MTQWKQGKNHKINKQKQIEKQKKTTARPRNYYRR